MFFVLAATSTRTAISLRRDIYLALRHTCAQSNPHDEGVSSIREHWIPDNRVVRSAVLVAVYSVVFFPMSALPGTAAEFFSIIPIAIIASALRGDDDLAKARIMGASDYVTKPWSAATLLERLRWALSTSKST